jgi:hypothetical protein
LATDFTVIQPVRQRFGDTNHEEFKAELEAPFVGQAKDFPFSCPNVDTAQAGVLQFESYGVTTRNIIQINDVDIPGGITPGAFFALLTQYGVTTPLSFWKAHSLLIPANVLTEQNVLHIESVPTLGSFTYGTEDETFDNFIIDNVVVFFKTRVRIPGGIGEAAAT